MSVIEVALHPHGRDTGEAIVELRQQVAEAVARQRRLREEISPLRDQAGAIEDEARRAVTRGEDLLARQILARGLFTLATREHLEKELHESRGRVARLLTTLVRAEDQAWGIKHADAMVPADHYRPSPRGATIRVP